MALIADGLLLLAAAVAALYCYVLSRRLERLNGLEGGLGKAITALSDRVDQMSAALEHAKSSTEAAASQLRVKTVEAEVEIKKLTGLIESARGAHAALTIADDSARSADSRLETTRAPAETETEEAAFAPPAAHDGHASENAADAPYLDDATDEGFDPEGEEEGAPNADTQLAPAVASVLARMEPSVATDEEEEEAPSPPPLKTKRQIKRPREGAAAKAAARRKAARSRPGGDTELASEIGSIIAEGKAGDKDAMLRRLIAVLGDAPTPGKENAA